ncbi:hypothetical protein MUN82_18280 [Hymenobacter aerilatus]|uniref:Roadblock/LAMTOR2 domain-containing protein n=1 Tax=Hymenobacter aerilatus TaxID=2932251 RepID=A0A8T9SRW0_9BACT|nr:hypothetical protein [Hymenobacter aerilatus]UOR04878.1 hypothetical protein MUN82_18280 [Hymenobacter aerilatus]
MQIPFLNRLQSLSGATINKVVPAGNNPEHQEAAQILQRVLEGLPELVAAAVVQIETGQAMATYMTSRDFNPTKVAGYNASLVREQYKVLTALQPGSDEQLEEIVITLPTQLHLLRILTNQQQFLYVAVESRDTNLGIAREVMRSCE